MQANRILMWGSLGVAVAGAVFGGFLALPAEMSAPRHAASVITARDPNYAAYLKMLASLGPAPARGARHAPRPLSPWTEAAAYRTQPRDEARYLGRDEARDDEWVDVVDEAEAPPIVRYRAPPAYAVTYYGPPAPDYRRDVPERGEVYYPVRPWGGDRAGRSARYGGQDLDEPTPPPPPMPSGY